VGWRTLFLRIAEFYFDGSRITAVTRELYSAVRDRVPNVMHEIAERLSTSLANFPQRPVAFGKRLKFPRLNMLIETVLPRVGDKAKKGDDPLSDNVHVAVGTVSRFNVFEILQRSASKT